ncbi:MAG TPA: MFS transporter [Candidatus Limnocylindrales bacterium]|nr:MFS transporter [Candidatus Limnocylindrales bacterium]
MTVSRSETALDRLRSQLRMSLGVVRAILHSPALRRVEIAFLLFSAVEYGTWIAILLYAYAATGPASVGIVALVQLLPAAVVAPLAASLADRFPRDRILFAGYVVQAVAFGATALAMAAGAPPVIVYACATMATSSLTVTRPTQGALLPSISRTPEELTAANGLSGTVEGMGLLLGPLAAAAILAFTSEGAVFGAAAIVALVAAALVMRLPRTAPTPAPRPDEGPEPGDAEGLLAGIRAVARAGDTRLLVGILALRMLTSGAMDVLFVLLALEAFHIGESGAGLLNAALGLGTIIGGALTFSLVGRQRLAPFLAAAAAVWGATLAIIGTSALVWLALPLIVVGGVGVAACDMIGRTILQRVTPDRMLARVLGTLEGVGLASLAVGAILVPVVAAVIGVQATLIVVGLLLPVGVGIGWLRLTTMDRTTLLPTRALQLLRAVPLFAPLYPPQLENVARRARWITIEPGAVIIRQGETGDAYYVLESGELEVSQGGKLLRTTMDWGYGFGEIALLRDVPRTATVRALAPSVLLTLGRADFLEAVTGHPQAQATATRIAAERAASGLG